MSHLPLLLIFLLFLFLQPRNMAIRGSLYFGSNWQPFSYIMPTYILNHINGSGVEDKQFGWSAFLSGRVLHIGVLRFRDPNFCKFRISPKRFCSLLG